MQYFNICCQELHRIQVGQKPCKHLNLTCTRNLFTCNHLLLLVASIAQSEKREIIFRTQCAHPISMPVLKSDLVSRSARKSPCKNFNYNFLPTFVIREALAAAILGNPLNYATLPSIERAFSDWKWSALVQTKSQTNNRLKRTKGRSDAKH